jgi:hypothetical protein
MINSKRFISLDEAIRYYKDCNEGGMVKNWETEWSQLIEWLTELKKYKTWHLKMKARYENAKRDMIIGDLLKEMEGDEDDE